MSSAVGGQFTAGNVERHSTQGKAGAWPRVQLGQVLRRFNEIIHPGDRASGHATFVGLEHIESGTGRRIGSATVNFASMTGRKPTFRRGQIVYGYLRPYLNKVWIAEFDGCSSVDQFAFDVDESRARPEYLAAFLRSELFLQRAAKATTPGQLPRISIEEIEGVELELPPPTVQERIAGRLTEQLAAVDCARAAAQARLDAAQALPAAYLRDVFEGPEWPQMALQDGLRAIEAGTSVQSLERPARDGEWGVLKVSAVSWGRFKADQNKAVPVGFVPKPHEHVRRGDLLISRANTQELAGAVVIVREDPERLMLSDKTLRLVLREDVLDSEYLEYAMRTRAARKFIEHNATGTSYSMRNISQDTIRAIPLPVPPVAEQKRIANILSRRGAAVQRLADHARDELDAIEALPATLLRESFGNGGGDE